METVDHHEFTDRGVRIVFDLEDHRPATIGGSVNALEPTE
jgi:hypothetical protein